MQVEMNNIEAHVAESGAAEEGVLVSAVAVEEGAMLVQEISDAGDVRVKEAEKLLMIY